MYTRRRRVSTYLVILYPLLRPSISVEPFNDRLMMTVVTGVDLQPLHLANYLRLYDVWIYLI
jgi:hypothetical protein